MKRIDRIISSALKSSDKNGDFSQQTQDISLATAKVKKYFEVNVAEREDGVNAPAAAAPIFTPLRSPLKPITTNGTIEYEDDVDSPAAPLYSPLTPLVAASRTLERKDSSPLPLMSPETFKLFETVNQTIPTIEEFAEFDKTFNNSNIEEAMEPMGIEVPDSNITKKDKNQETDFSCDTDSDYAPDSEEDSDNRCSKKCYVPESEDDSDDCIPRAMVQTHVIVHSSEKQNTKTRTETSNTLNSSTNTSDATYRNVSYDKETVDNIITNSQNQNKDFDQMETQNECQVGRPRKGRKRKYPDHTIAQIKERKYKNLPYNRKNKRVESKVFADYACNCNKQCFAIVSKGKRKEEFEIYTSLGSYEAQLLYILNNVKESSKARIYTATKNNKNGKKKPRVYRRHYSIRDIEVCKEMFLKNFQISSKKIDISLKKNRDGNVINDQRGKAQGGWNKTSEDDVNFIKNIINSLPKYESHYRRGNNSDCQYLKLGMTIQKIYEIYMDELKNEYDTSKKPVSFATLKRIFYSHFNLRCKSLKKDTCNKCDRLTNKIKNCTSADQKQKLQEEKKEHQKRAQDLRTQMNNDLLRAKTDKLFECLTFDLEKTLPLPRIPTNIVFYKRQLWLYNSGIHVGSTDTGHCNVWVEGEAGRGSQEVGSCLVHFIQNNLDKEVEELVLWSDCCGGQNRNIKIVIMLKAILNDHPKLKTIKLKYLESGHTFLPNDTDFSKIEYQLKYHERIYTPEEYINVMKSCKKKNPLQVYRMKKEDFISTSEIERNIVNRKTFKNTKDKVNWLTTKEILLKKEFEYSIFMKCFNQDFRELDVMKKVKGQCRHISKEDFVLLWPNGKEIAQAKLDDLMSMLEMIPLDCRKFYLGLKGNKNIREDVDGFGGELDFVILAEEDRE